MGGSAGQDGQQADDLHRGAAGGVSGESGRDGGWMPFREALKVERCLPSWLSGTQPRPDLCPAADWLSSHLPLHPAALYSDDDDGGGADAD